MTGFTQVLMGAGSFTVDLVPETPTWVKETLPCLDSAGTDQWRSHVIFTAHDDPNYDDLTESLRPFLMSAADCVFAGPVFRRGQKMTKFAGPSMTGWIQNQRGQPGAASFGASRPAVYPTTITALIQDWFGTTGTSTNGIRYGTAYSAPATAINAMDTDTYLPGTKTILDQLMAQVGCEYRVNHDGTIDWGAATSLWNAVSPLILCADGVTASHEFLRVLDCTIKAEDSIEGYRNAAKVKSSDGLLGAVDTNSSLAVRTVYNGGFGQFFPDTVTVNTTNLTDVTNLAAATSDLYAEIDRTITVETNDFCVSSTVAAGDSAYVWSPEDFIHDDSFDLEVAGLNIHPENLRITQIEQPFQVGMGCYVARYAGSGNYTTTRITDYVIPSTSPTRLRIGSRPQPLGAVNRAAIR